MHLKCPGTVLLTMMMFKWGEFSLFLNTYNHRGKKGVIFYKDTFSGIHILHGNSEKHMVK